MQLPVRLFPLLVLSNLIWIGLEGLGIGLLLPVFELLRSGSSVDSAELQGWYWDALRTITGFLGIQLSLAFLLAASFTFLVLRQVFNYLNAIVHGITKRRTADRIRRKAFQAFLRADTSVQDEIRIGEVSNELTVELDRALSSIFSAIRAFGSLFQVVAYVGGLLLLSPLMTALSLGVICVFAFSMRNLLRAVKTTGAAITEANTELTGFFVERLQRARLVRLSGTERAEAKAFGHLSRRQVEGDLRHRLLTTRLTLLPEPIVIGFAYVALYIGNQVLDLSLEALGLFVIVLIRLMPIVKSIIGDYNNVIGKWPAVEKIDRRLEQLLDGREDKGGDTVFNRLDGAILYKRVSFSYRGGKTSALSNISVTLPAHRITALVGPSGTGKSTFVDLLPRLRDPDSGRILFDGIPITEFSTASLRAGIAFVPQEPQIFNISAAEHIRYGKENATDEEVREAARLAGALSFIEALPEGFETLLGDGGSRLSGGQRQRLDIARALVRRAPILILDEPTSALDAGAESAFRDALRTLRRETGLTIIVIAHRLSTIADADKIVVLRDSRLDAAGTHDELMAAGGWYADAHEQQFGVRAATDPRAATIG